MSSSSKSSPYQLREKRKISYNEFRDCSQNDDEDEEEQIDEQNDDEIDEIEEENDEQEEQNLEPSLKRQKETASEIAVAASHQADHQGDLAKNTTLNEKSSRDGGDQQLFKSLVDNTSTIHHGTTTVPPTSSFSSPPNCKMMENDLGVELSMNKRWEMVKTLLTSIQSDCEQQEEMVSDVMQRATFTEEEIKTLDYERLKKLRKILQDSVNLVIDALIEKK